MVQLVERYRVYQRQRRHVTERIPEHQPDEPAGQEPARGRGVGGKEQQHGAEQVKNPEDFLAGKEPVGDQPDDERGDDRRDRVGGVGITDDQAELVRFQSLGQPAEDDVLGHRHEIRPPDKKLEEHHHRQLETNGWFGIAHDGWTGCRISAADARSPVIMARSRLRPVPGCWGTRTPASRSCPAGWDRRFRSSPCERTAAPGPTRR